jgi:hypothetical protein
METNREPIEIVNESIDEMLWNIIHCDDLAWKQVYKHQVLAMLHLSISLGIIPKDERNTYLGRIVNSL